MEFCPKLMVANTPKAKYPPGSGTTTSAFYKLTYAIFGAEAGWLEVYQLDASDGISLSHRMPIDATGLQALGYFWVYGNKANHTGYWLRWWDESRQMLLWGTERLQQSRATGAGSR